MMVFECIIGNLTNSKCEIHYILYVVESKVVFVNYHTLLFYSTTLLDRSTYARLEYPFNLILDVLVFIVCEICVDYVTV